MAYGRKNMGGLDNIDDLLNESPITLDDCEEELDMPRLNIDMDEVNSKAELQAKTIVERLSNYYFDEKYIKEHPYIPNKIASEMDNIRMLLKMLSVNEKAQDTLLMSIAINAGKGALYQSLTSLQSAMLNIQKQLEVTTNNIEDIFRTMQDECDKSFAEKDKEEDDGHITVRGSREFINMMVAKQKAMSVPKSEEPVQKII